MCPYRLTRYEVGSIQFGTYALAPLRCVPEHCLEAIGARGQLSRTPFKDEDDIIFFPPKITASRNVIQLNCWWWREVMSQGRNQQSWRGRKVSWTQLSFLVPRVPSSTQPLASVPPHVTIFSTLERNVLRYATTMRARHKISQNRTSSADRGY